ncbi:MAG TPA: DUF1573 domain-containing protein [Edaphocola sp.]|nr:DUF1573 domain-containing protein [Edaphocola sp.]
MKKLFSVILIFCSLFAFAQQSGPAFKFKDANNTHDFGTVKEGTDAVYSFEFTNVGNQPILIQEATSTCGCTTPDWPKAPVLPGKTGKITVKYQTQGRVGPIDRTVFIKSNASKTPIELKITGTVVK